MQRERDLNSCLACEVGILHPYWSRFLKCEQCGFVSREAMPSAESVKALYEKRYFFGGEYLDYCEEAPALRVGFAHRLGVLRRYIRGGRLVEVGCAYGYFLDLARSYFEVRGCEISRDAAAHCVGVLGLDVATTDFSEVILERGAYDAIVMWDCIEHLVSPDRCVEKASVALRPNGLLALTTGDIGSLVARLRGRRWRMIHPPDHLHHFSRSSIQALLLRFGFEVLEIRYDWTWRRLKQMLYRTLIDWRWRPTTVRRVVAMFPLDLVVPLNLFDIMFVIARRRSDKWDIGRVSESFSDAARA